MPTTDGIRNTFFAANREAWRGWLERYAETEREVWLILSKKHLKEACVTLDEAVEEALCFGWIDGLLRRIDDRRHLLRFTPRRKDSRWSERNKGRVERMIAEGKMTAAGLDLVEHARRSGEWDEASGSLRDRPMPEELQRALDQDPPSRDWFEALALTPRRQFLGWIHEAKREETRQRRIAKVLQMIRSRTKPGL